MDPKLQLSQICEMIAKVTSLQEGPSGVEALLRQVHRLQPAAPKTIAAEVGLPIPLVSAIRRELEKEGWLIRKGGMCLSANAVAVADSIWGKSQEQSVNPPCQDKVRVLPTVLPDISTAVGDESEEAGLGGDEPVDVDEMEVEEEDVSTTLDYLPIPLSGEDEPIDPFLELLEEMYEERPSADPRWDQSHATLDTVLSRAELFLELGVIQGKRCLFLGDDDLTSLVTLLMVRKKLGEDVLRRCMVAVAEIDPRLAEFISDMALSEDLPLAVVQADLCESLPKPLVGSFDFFFTDPPYTPDGAGLFLERGAQALDPKGLRRAGLAIPLSPPALQVATQRHLQRLGYVIDFLNPRFNEYLGATMQGGVSALYGLTLVGGQEFEEQGSGSGPKAIYTRDWKAVREKFSRKV